MLIAGQYWPAADAFERLDDCGRLDRQATEETRIGGVADISRAQPRLFQPEPGHIGGIDAKIDTLPSTDAIGLRPGHLSRELRRYTASNERVWRSGATAPKNGVGRRST
jgi:hypothetical protein